MNNTRVPVPQSPTLSSLVVEDLHYCCTFGFFEYVKASNSARALRLGCASRTVEYQKARWRAGKWRCEGKPNCLGCAGGQVLAAGPAVIDPTTKTE